MATVRKRIGKTGRASWQLDYRDPHGKRVRLSFKKKKDAEAELGKRVSLIFENRYLDVKKDYRATLEMLCKKYEENFKYQVSFQNAKKTYLENFKEYFGKDTLLSYIRYHELESYRNHLRQKPVTAKLRDGKKVVKSIRTDAATNREMSCLHHLFSKAEQWEMVEQSPFSKGPSLLLKESNQRLRFLDESEIQRLLDACPLYLKRIVRCAILTGMRRGEILSLKWEQIRNGFIYLRETKTKEPREIPIGDDLDQIFKEIRRELHLTSPYVFTYEGKAIDGLKTSFTSALKRAGIQDFRFHDLRHTFASQVLLQGGTLKDIQELLGHKTMTMTLRYAHLSQEHKKRAVNLLNGLTTQENGSGHKMVTSANVTQPATV